MKHEPNPEPANLQPECEQGLMSDKSRGDESRNFEPGDDVTVLLTRWQSGDDHALEMLLPLVYNDLRRMAGR